MALQQVQNKPRLFISFPVKRLGSIMDAGPALRLALSNIPERTHLIASSESMLVFPEMFGEAMSRGAVIRQVGSKGENVEVPGTKMDAFLPIGDDKWTCRQALRMLERIDPSCDKRGWYGSDFFAQAVNFALQEEDDDVDVNFGNIVHEKELDKPRYMNLYLQACANAISRVTGSSIRPDSKDALPFIKTNRQAEAAAVRFFEGNRLSGKNTLAIHACAGTWNVFGGVWPREYFLSTAEVFARQGWNILFITGYLKDPSTLRADNFRAHDSMVKELDRTLAGCRKAGRIAHFTGDVFEQAEVIRNSNVFLSIDTGLAHIATAVGTPKVTIAANKGQMDYWVYTGRNDSRFMSWEDTTTAKVSFGPHFKAVVEAIESIASRK